MSQMVDALPAAVPTVNGPQGGVLADVKRSSRGARAAFRLAASAETSAVRVAVERGLSVNLVDAKWTSRAKTPHSKPIEEHPDLQVNSV
jgi:hypothetical protein